MMKKEYITPESLVWKISMRSSYMLKPVEYDEYGIAAIDEDEDDDFDGGGAIMGSAARPGGGDGGDGF